MTNESDVARTGLAKEAWVGVSRPGTDPIRRLPCGMTEHDAQFAEAALTDAGHAVERTPAGNVRVLLGRRSHQTFDTLQHVLEWLDNRECRDQAAAP